MKKLLLVFALSVVFLLALFQPVETQSAYVIRSAAVTTPAAGAEFVMTVTSGQTWLLKSCAATFTTSSTNTNRNIGFKVKDATPSTVLQAYNTTNYTQTLTTPFSFFPMATWSNTAGTMGGVGFPADLILGSGWTFNSFTKNIDTTDQWSAITCAYVLVR